MAYERFFRNSSIDSPLWFDEGPRIPENHPAEGSIINSSSIETAAIDPYRQGVSLTQQKHYDAGTVKIHAGEPGHVLRRNRYGMDKNFRPDPGFEELDYFNPVDYLEAQEFGEPLYDGIFTFPIITGDNDQIENYWSDGIIEPLPIREVASFFSIEMPFMARGVRAGIMAGNEDSSRASEWILTVDEFSERTNFGYLDLIDMFGSYSTVGYFINEQPPLEPYVDRRLISSVSASSHHDAELIEAMTNMTGSTDNYIGPDQRSATSGWTYDGGMYPGTDSIAFGGMTY